MYIETNDALCPTGHPIYTPRSYPNDMGQLARAHWQNTRSWRLRAAHAQTKFDDLPHIARARQQVCHSRARPIVSHVCVLPGCCGKMRHRRPIRSTLRDTTRPTPRPPIRFTRRAPTIWARCHIISGNCTPPARIPEPFRGRIDLQYSLPYFKCGCNSGIQFESSDCAYVACVCVIFTPAYCLLFASRIRGKTSVAPAEVYGAASTLSSMQFVSNIGYRKHAHTHTHSHMRRHGETFRNMRSQMVLRRDGRREGWGCVCCKLRSPSPATNSYAHYAWQMGDWMDANVFAV